MAKLRKMLGDIESQECKGLMKVIETQSVRTLASWAIGFVKERYLPVYKAVCPESYDMGAAIELCEKYLVEELTLKEIKPVLREARQAASAIKDPVGQAAARAIATACAVIQTPTNALGFTFYGAAAAAYNQAGLEEKADVYNELAAEEMRNALRSLQEVSIADETNPASIKWGC